MIEKIMVQNFLSLCSSNQEKENHEP